MNANPIHVIVLALAAGASFTGCTTSRPATGMDAMEQQETASFYLPNAEASQVVSVRTNGPVLANILVQTHRVAVKETGPKETVARFGEVYAFSPTFFAVHRDEPTQIRFWNLQPDNRHDFMMVDPQGNVLMSVRLPALEEISYVFTFHQEGLFHFYCAMHPRTMTGQILVLPSKAP